MDEADEELRGLIDKYFGLDDDDDKLAKIIRALMASVSDIAMFEIQDFFGYGNESKINSPSTIGNNWKWRSIDSDYDDNLAKRIKEMSKIYGRYNYGQTEKE